LWVRTRVWAFAHVCDGAVIGDDCSICDHTFIEKAFGATVRLS
jgi:UDP-3-O-[3-hydroxymyristoyl] glucosamine N-acyltransferase